MVSQTMDPQTTPMESIGANEAIRLLGENQKARLGHRSFPLGIYTYPSFIYLFLGSIWSPQKNKRKCRKHVKHVAQHPHNFPLLPLPFFAKVPGRSVQSFGLTSPAALQRCFYQIQVILEAGGNLHNLLCMKISVRMMIIGHVPGALKIKLFLQVVFASQPQFRCFFSASNPKCCQFKSKLENQLSTVTLWLWSPCHTVGFSFFSSSSALFLHVL